MEYLIYWGAAAAALTAISVLLKKPSRVIRRRLKQLAKFLDDWQGRPERRDASGAVVEEAEPGALARLRAAEHELQHNGGGSVKDAVARIESSLALLTQRQETSDNKLDEHIEIAKQADAANAVDSELLHQLADRYLEGKRDRP